MNLEGANSGGLGTEVPQRGPGAEPRADDFSQLKGYLDVLWRDLVTSGILGGHGPLAPPPYIRQCALLVHPAH